MIGSRYRNAHRWLRVAAWLVAGCAVAIWGLQRGGWEQAIIGMGFGGAVWVGAMLAGRWAIRSVRHDPKSIVRAWFGAMAWRWLVISAVAAIWSLLFEVDRSFLGGVAMVWFVAWITTESNGVLSECVSRSEWRTRTCSI